MSNVSTKPYLIRAIYEWCVDQGFTPYLATLVDADTRNILMVKREERKNSDPGSMGLTKIEKDYPLC